MNMTHPKTTEGRTIAVVGDIYRFLATGEEPAVQRMCRTLILAEFVKLPI